jgi:hypothetical protein
MANKRTFDEIESDSVLDMLSIELLLHMIVVGELNSRDITNIASLNKGYKSILYANGEYLRKRGYWTFNIKAKRFPFLHSDVRPIRLPERPHCGVYVSTHKDIDTDLLTIAYQIRSDILILTVYQNNMNVRWMRRIAVDEGLHGFAMIASTLGIILIPRMADRIILLNPANGEELTADSLKLPFIFNYCCTIGLIAERVVITRVQKDEHWIVSRDTETSPSPLTFKQNKTKHVLELLDNTSNYYVFRSSSDRKWLIGEFPSKEGDDLTMLGPMRGISRTFVRMDEIIIYDEYNTRIINAKESMKNRKAHITHAIPSEGYSLIGVTLDASILIYSKEIDNTWIYAWYIRADDTWIYTQLKQQRTYDLEPQYYIDGTTGNVWHWDEWNSVVYRIGPQSSTAYGGLCGVMLVQFIGIYAERMCIYTSSQ